MKRINYGLYEKIEQLSIGTFIRVFPYESGQVIRGNLDTKGPNFITLINHDATWARSYTLTGVIK